MKRYELHYKTLKGEPMRLVNLALEVVNDIKRIQSHLGSTDFRVIEQTHAYSSIPSPVQQEEL